MSARFFAATAAAGVVLGGAAVAQAEPYYVPDADISVANGVVYIQGEAVTNGLLRVRDQRGGVEAWSAQVNTGPFSAKITSIPDLDADFCLTFAPATAVDGQLVEATETPLDCTNWSRGKRK